MPRNSIGSRPVVVAGFEPSAFSGVYGTAGTANNGTVAVTQGLAYRIVNTTATNPLWLGFTTINDGTTLVSTSAVTAVMAAGPPLDLVIPDGYSILHFCATGGTVTWIIAEHNE